MNSFVINHFGNNIKYFKYELKNSDIKYIINKCSEESFTNGGIIIIL